MKARDFFVVMAGNRRLLIAAVAITAIALALGVGPAAAVAPVVTVENASNVEYTTADVKGTVNPEGQSTSWRFQYATQGDFSDAQEGPSGSTETPENVSGPLTGLQPGTTYHLRLLADNADGPGEAVAASSFTTKAVTKPTPGEPQVPNLTGHTADFQATVDTNAPEDNSLLSQAAKDAYKTHWWFTCQPGCSFAGPSEGDVAADDVPATVEADATGLLANKEYTVVLHAQNAAGEETSQTTFSTPLTKPEVTRQVLDGIEPGSTEFTALGEVDPNGSKVTDCRFVYGVGAASGHEVPCSPRSPAFGETQNVSVEGRSGQYRLIFEGEATADLSAQAKAAEVQAALEALPAIGPENVSVSERSFGPGYSKSWQLLEVSFQADLGGKNVPALEWENGSEPLGGFFGEYIADILNFKQFASPIYHGSGQFRFKFRSELTAALPMGASGTEVQEALEGLASIDPGDVSVVEEQAPFASGTIFLYKVTFEGSLSKDDRDDLTVEPAPFLPGDLFINDDPFHQGSLNGLVPVSARLSGLSPDTEYRYRVVATNAAGTTEGPEVAFRTRSLPQLESCSNASIRSEQHSTSANCRGFEMVSPADKNGANVTGEEFNVLASDDGNGAFFTSRGGFAGAAGSGRTGFSHYLSRRGPGGWTTKGITPTPPPEAIQALFGGTDFFYFSPDLSRAVLWGYDLPAADDVASNDNLYRMDTAGGGLETVTLASQLDGPIGFDDFNGNAPLWGASEDTGVVSFATSTHLLPQAVKGGGMKNAYEWDHGTLRLAGILPNGEVPAGGSEPPQYRSSVSSDGSRVLFLSPYKSENQQIYVRRNHTDTVWVSEPEFGSPGEPENLRLEWVSQDAKRILFKTTTPLLADDTDDGADLYSYTDSPDPQSKPDNLKLISTSVGISAQPGDATSTVVLGATEDAEVIYYRRGSSGNEIVLYDHGVVRNGPNNLDPAESSPLDYPGTTRLSADGRFFGYRGPDGQVYLYDAEEDTRACVACRRDGVASAGVPAVPAANPGSIRKALKGLRPRFLTDDGRVFFSTASPLVAADTNGVVDTYVYDGRTGERELISTGKGEHGQWFENASKSGDDVFLVTNQSLVGGDGDSLADLYDARVGGGFPEPPPQPTPCVGDNCRNQLSGTVSGASPATSAFSGAGNRHCKPRRSKKPKSKECASKRRAKKCSPKRRAKKRCPSKHRSKKHPSSHRSGGRG